jgi:Glycosyltransferase sugar-binding region containing DXD motif
MMGSHASLGRSARHYHRGSSSAGCTIATILLVLVLLLPTTTTAANTKMTVAVYASMPSEEDAVARKQQYDLEHIRSSLDTISQLDIHYLTETQQRAFLEDRSEVCADGHGITAVSVWDSLQGTSASVMHKTELFKWCALAAATTDMSLWLDSHSPILNGAALEEVLRSHDNVAVGDDSSSGSGIIHGSYLQMRTTVTSKQLAQQMLQMLLQTDPVVVQTHALLVPRTLHALLEKANDDWYYLHLKCRKGTAKQQQESRSHLACPVGYCCSIQDRTAGTTVMVSRHYVVPYQSIPEHHDLPTVPFHPDTAVDDLAERPFISTITVKEIPSDDNKETPNLYDILARANCLPDHDNCSKCLREKKGATCKSCAAQCPCYCQKLCHTAVPHKRVVQEWTVTPPPYTKDPTRLIPRIVHQTWFEPLDGTDAYPNMSRLVESFKQSGWEYRFYTDDDAALFLQTHFPPAVLEAYRAIQPGAFKADLFRYCVLLITGGVYADVDIQLESALDLSIPPDVGFMVPIDEVRMQQVLICSVHLSMAKLQGFADNGR